MVIQQEMLGERSAMKVDLIPYSQQMMSGATQLDYSHHAYEAEILEQLFQHPGLLPHHLLLQSMHMLVRSGDIKTHETKLHKMLSYKCFIEQGSQKHEVKEGLPLLLSVFFLPLTNQEPQLHHCPV